MAAELETALDESSHLMQSHGGVFEVEDNGKLIYSKRNSGRFPGDGEILRILQLLDSGLPLDQAQEEAAKDAPPLPSFVDWLAKFWKRKGSAV